MKNFNILSKARWLLIAALATIVSTNVWGYTYTQLTSIANIDQYAVYVLGVEGSGSGKGFHYSGTSSWGLTAGPTTQTPLYYTLVPNNNNTNFKASTTISNTTYYLQVPTSNTFSMNTSSTAANTTLIIGTTQVSGTNYAVANSGTTNRHLRINGTSGLRSYAGTTGSMAFFYIVRCANPTSLTNGTIASSTAHLSWTDNTNTNCSYEIYCSTSSSTPASNVTPTATVSTKYVDLTGLESSTTYNWWVRAKDNTNSAIKSNWVKGSNFTTTAAAYTVGWSITDGGTLSATSGMSTTVTPASGYRYASPAYTVLTGAATVVQSTNTFTATPTANSTICINMEEIPSHTLSFNTGGLVTIPSVSVLEGATYNITQTPAESLSEDCEYGTFVGWTTASSIADASVCPTIITSYTMSTSDVTLYAVYSKTTGGSGASVGATIFAEDFSSYSSGNVPSGSVTTNSNGRTVYGDANVTYACVDGSSNTKIYAETIAGGTSPELLVGKSGGSFSIDGIPSGEATTLTLSFRKNNKTFTPSVTGTGYSIGSISGGNPYSYTITVGSASTFKLTLTPGSDNVRLDDISITVATTSNAGTTSYSMSANCNMPKITVSKTSIDFGDVKVGGSYTETFTVSGENLEGNITLAVTGNARYSVNQTTLTPTNGTVSTTEITVTFAPTASGNNGAQVDITSTNAATKTVTLKGYSKWEVTWLKNGDAFATTLVAGGSIPDFPAEDPTSCDVESNTFYGWTTEEWPGKLDNLAGKTVYTTNSGMATVSDNNRVYYAVFAKGTGSGSECYKKVTSTGSISNDGRYLIVYETGEVAFKGSLTSLDVTDNTIDVTFDGSDITADATTKVNEFTIDVTNLYVKSASNRWINRDAYSNGLGNNTSATSVHSISIDGSGNLVIQGTGESSGSYVQLKYNANADQSRFRFYTSGQQDIQLYKYDPGVTYSKFLTNCCNMPTLAFAASPYATIRQDIGGASTTTWAVVDVTFTSNSSGTISAATYSNGSVTDGTAYQLAASKWQVYETTGGTLCGASHAYFEVLTQPSGETPGTGKFHVKTAGGQTGQGTYRIALTQESTEESHGNFCETTVYGFVDVTLRDKFVDNVNGNGTVNKDGHGAQLATPALSELGTQVENACHSEGRKLKGWIKETDLKSKYETGNSERVQTIDGLCETCDDATDWTSLIVAPGTNVTMSGATWYAVWAYER